MQSIPDATRYDLEIGEVVRHGSPTSIDLSSFRRLQCLTIRTKVFFEGNRFYHESLLPAVIEIIKTASSVQHLNIEIYVEHWRSTAGHLLDEIDLSLLAALAALTFHHIDLYIRPILGIPITLSTILSLLADNKGLMKLIDQGRLVIHPEETAPSFLETVRSRSTLVQHPRSP
jgi:hypothetical protein